MRTHHDSGGEVLLVSGGASGIGAAIAVEFAAAGGTSVILDVTDPGAVPARVEQHRVDVSDRAAVHRVVDQVLARHGRIDGLIAGAAVQPRVSVAEMPEEVWRKTLAVNLDGTLWCCQAVLPGMRSAQRGSIVIFASGLGQVGRAGAASYAASKGALIAFSKSLAAEVAGDRIRVNTIFPGVIDTPQFQAANPFGGEREHWAATTGIGTPGDVVGPLMFLLSDAATMTGSTLTRDRAYPRERSGAR